MDFLTITASVTLAVLVQVVAWLWLKERLSRSIKNKYDTDLKKLKHELGIKEVNMTSASDHAHRWIWFLDVVFGAIVALGIQRYEQALRDAWSHGIGDVALSIFVSIAIFSFVVYDIAVYHTLARKYPYRITALGFARFYLDLIMAFSLYVLLVNAFQFKPNLIGIISAISFWHFAAFFWHWMARREHGVSGGFLASAVFHIFFIAVYFLTAFLSFLVGHRLLGIEGTELYNLVLITLSATILFVSLFRWNQVIKQVST